MLVPCYAALSLLLILRHEMWRDELEDWLIAKDSPSFSEMLATMKYGGHPVLWFACLRVLSRLTDQALSMQLLHWVIATAVVYVVVRFAPLTRLQRVLFVFGYFPLYEYAVISRSYSLGVLLTFVACALFSAQKRNYGALAIVLALLANTNAQALIVAMALGLACLADGALTVRAGKAGPSQWGLTAATVLVAGAGIAASIVRLVPPADTGVAVGWKTDLDLRWFALTIENFWRSYVPLPQAAYQLWNTNILDSVHYTSPYPQAILSIPLIVLSFLLVVGRPAALLLWGTGSLGLLAFWYTKYSGSLRHHGHLFILLLAACWIREAAMPWGPVNGKPWGFGEIGRRRLLTGLLTVQLAAGGILSAMDFAFPFSASRETALFIETVFPRDMVIVGDRDYPAMAVAGYLNRRIYYPAVRRFGTFVVLDQTRFFVQPPELIRQVNELSQQLGDDVLLLLNYRLSSPFNVFPLLREFENSILPIERYYLYLARYPGPSPRSRSRSPL
jgi:hypothetical protein